MKTRLRQPMPSLPKQILIQSLQYKMSNCLMQPVTTFFSPKWKKPVKNNHYKTLPNTEMGNKHKANMHKKNISLIIFTLKLLYNAKFA